MPLVAFSFGAFGDIATICDLLMRVVQALAESAGASPTYQALIAELDCFRDCLLNLQYSLGHLCSHGQASGPLFRHLCITKYVEECHSTIEAIQARIVGIQKKFKRGCPRNRWMESWRKIGWGLFTEAEISGFRENIQRHMATFQAVMTIINS
jgi:hypothetical protein